MLKRNAIFCSALTILLIISLVFLLQKNSKIQLLIEQASSKEIQIQEQTAQSIKMEKHIIQLKNDIENSEESKNKAENILKTNQERVSEITKLFNFILATEDIKNTFEAFRNVTLTFDNSTVQSGFNTERRERLIKNFLGYQKVYPKEVLHEMLADSNLVVKEITNFNNEIEHYVNMATVFRDRPTQKYMLELSNQYTFALWKVTMDNPVDIVLEEARSLIKTKLNEMQK